MKPSRFPLLIILLFMGAIVFAQTTRYVAPGGTNNPNNCTDPMNPCGSVQYAHNIANSGDIIDIAAGEYTRTTDAFTISKSITLQGAGQDITFLQAHPQQHQATHRVITISPLPIHVEIIGLTIRHGVALGSGVPGRGGGIYYDFDSNNPGSLVMNETKLAFNQARVGGGIFSSSGSAPVFNGVYFQANNATERGGGMYSWTDSSPEFNSVIFQGNAAGLTAGGIYCNKANAVFIDTSFIFNYGVSGCGGLVLQNESHATILVSAFTNNETEGNGGGLCMDGNSTASLENVIFENNSAYNGNGGGMHLVNYSSPTLTNVTFTGNHSGQYGGGMYNAAGNYSILLDVSFFNNSSSYGGAMANINNATPTLLNVTIIGNTAENKGGGMYNHTNSNPTIFNMIVADNEVLDPIFGDGGGIFNFDASPVIWNATISKNKAGLSNGLGGAMINFGNSTPLIYNTVFWANQAYSGTQIYNAATASATLSYSLFPDHSAAIVEGGGFSCNNCLQDDPLFADPGNNFFQLSSNSPAIDTGDPASYPLQYPDDGNGNAIDILGNPRFVGSAIDMGAFEWNSNLTINEISEQQPDIIIYPNPTKDRIHIQSWREIDQPVFLTLLGETLQLSFIENAETNTLTADVSSLASGTYLLKITSAGITETYKIIKF